MIRLLVLFALLSACASAPKHPEGGYGAPVLWQLADEDTTIHLFGTIHALPKDLNWRTERINAAFERSDSFCVETDADGKADEYRAYIQEFGFFDEGEFLSDHLGQEEMDDIYEVSDYLGLNRDYINSMKPWNLMFDLSQRVNQHLGLIPDYGVEFTLLPEARMKEKTICEMESPFDTVTSISTLPLETQITVLTHESKDLEGIDDLEAAFDIIREKGAELVDDWMRGDIGAMEAENVLDSYAHMDFYDAILVKRNRNWIPRIEALLDEPGTKFIAVGMAHMFGPDSVVKMLRDKGYDVKGP